MGVQKVANGTLGAYPVAVDRSAAGADQAERQAVGLDFGEVVNGVWTPSRASATNPIPVTSNTVYATRIDEGATYMYLGYAAPGASEASAVWRIGRFTLANVSGMEWADGDIDFDNVWSDRASLVYA